MITKEININELSVAESNVRKRNIMGIDALASNIKEVGLLHPLTVRKTDKGYEIVAGQRRFTAIQKLNLEKPSFKTVTCIVRTDDQKLDKTVSLSENSFTQIMDDVERCEAFTQLLKNGSNINKIAKSFGMKSHTVKQYLSIGNLLDEFRDLYYSKTINSEVLMYCTRFNKQDQKKIINAIKSDELHPSKHNIKNFMFKTKINPEYALFDIDKSGLAISQELFSDEKLVIDTNKFWEMQKAEIDKISQEHEKNGWDIKVFEPEDYFHLYSYSKATKKEGASVVIDIKSNGQVEIHKGILVNRKDAVDEESIKPTQTPRQEITSIAQGYYADWHYQMVRNYLTDNKNDCFVWFVTNLLCGNGIKFEVNEFNINEDDKQLKNAKITKNIDKNIDKFSEKYSFSRSWNNNPIDLYKKLSKLNQTQLIEICNAALISSLASNTQTIEFIGAKNNIKPLELWQSDNETINTFTSKDSTSSVAKAVISNKDKLKAFESMTLKQRRAVISENIKPSFIPPYMIFPISKYGDVKLNIEQEIK